MTDTLPDNTGYVAAAYLVFFALVLIYVVIMATKLARFERELSELDELADRIAGARGRPRGGALALTELLALGISHNTAPVALRERLALTDKAGRRFLQGARRLRRDRRGRRDLDLQPHRDLPRHARPGACRDRAAGPAGAPRRDPPDRAGRDRLLPAQLRRGPPALPRDRGPRLDDRRRGRGPGPGQARLRGRARCGHHRADDEPPVRRRSAGRQARALGDRDQPRARERVDGRRRPRSRRRRRPRLAVGRHYRRRRDRRADRAGAGQPGRAHGLRRQPPCRSRPLAGRALRRARSARWTRCRRGWRRPTSSSPRPRRRTRSSRPTSLEVVMRSREGRPLVFIDIAVPRDIDHACGALDGVSVYDMDDLQALVTRNLRVREAERAKAEAVVEEEIQRFARWLGAARRHADDHRAARARRRDRRPGAGRERRALGVGLAARPRPHRGRRAGGHAAAAARADDPPEGERARPPAGRCASCSGSTTRRSRRGPPSADVRPLKPPGVRIGTRGSALALAQARQVAALLGGEHEIVEVVTSGDRGEVASDKERWVRELDRALLDGTIDCAVHSAKDVPASLPDGVVIAAVPARADPRDALCGAGVAGRVAARRPRGHVLPAAHGATARAARTTSRSLELRGNVDTRLRKLGCRRLRRDRARRCRTAATGTRAATVWALRNWCPPPGRAAWQWRRRRRSEQLVACDRPTCPRRVRSLAERALVRGLEARLPHTGRRARAAEQWRSDAPRVRRRARRERVGARRAGRRRRRGARCARRRAAAERRRARGSRVTAYPGRRGPRRSRPAHGAGARAHRSGRRHPPRPPDPGRGARGRPPRRRDRRRRQGRRRRAGATGGDDAPAGRARARRAAPWCG